MIRGRAAFLFATAAIIAMLAMPAAAYVKRHVETRIAEELAKFGAEGEVDFSLIPLSLKIRGLTVRDEAGNTVASAGWIKAYLELPALLKNRVQVRRLTVENAYADFDNLYADKISALLSAGDGRSIGVSNIKLRGVSVKYRGGESWYEAALKTADIRSSGRTTTAALDAVEFNSSGTRRVLREKPFFDRAIIKVDAPGQDGLFKITEASIKTKGMEMKTSGVAGILKTGVQADINGKIVMSMEYVKRMFGLKRDATGEVSAQGSIKKYPGGAATVDLGLDGRFRLETLMEFLEEGQEPLSGLVSGSGRMTGTFPDLQADADAEIKGGNIYGLILPHGFCKVHYDKEKLRFLDGRADVYNGKATAVVELEMPRVDTFSLSVDMAGVDSEGLFKLLGWDPGISHGKVTGKLSSSGLHFDPYGWFRYEKAGANTSGATGADAAGASGAGAAGADDVLKRINKASGKFSMPGYVISLSDMALSTASSSSGFSGWVDVKNETMDFKGFVATDNVQDVAGRYIKGVRGRGRFDGGVAGTVANPVLSGTLALDGGDIRGGGQGVGREVVFSNLKVTGRYFKDALEIEKGSVNLYGGSASFAGKIGFRKSKHLFDFENPDFSLNLELRDMDAGRAAGKSPQVKSPQVNDIGDIGGIDDIDDIGDISGTLWASAKVSGTADNVRVDGVLKAGKPALGGVEADALDAPFTYSGGRWIFQNAELKRGASLVSFDASIGGIGGGSEAAGKSPGTNYEVKSKKCSVRAAGTPLERFIGDSLIECSFTGKGSFKEPAFTFNADIKGAKLKGLPASDGSVKASFTKNGIDISGAVFGGMVSLTGHMDMDNAADGKNPWRLDAVFKEGRYDFLLGGIVKQAPEDLRLTLAGEAHLSGTKNTVNGGIVMPVVVLTAYDYTFSNTAPVDVALRDKSLALNSLSMKGDMGEFSASGDIAPGRSYNLTLKGKPQMKPLKSFSDKISRISGNADFLLKITGMWEKPEVRGTLDIRDAALGIKNFRYFLGNIDASILFDKDRVVVSRFNSKIGAGTVSATGAANVENFRLKKFYLDMNLRDVPVTFDSGLKAALAGSVLYKGDVETQSIAGDIRVVRAEFRRNLSWRDVMFEKKPVENQTAQLGLFRATQLNVSVSGNKDIVIDNNVVKADIKADLMIRGTLGAPLVFGRIETQRGRFYFRNNDFNIINASVDFTGRQKPDPYFSVSSEATVKGYDVRLNLNGQLSRFNMYLTSSPHLDETDILSLLSVGRTGSALAGLESGIGTQEAASLLAGKYKDVVEDRLRNLTGLDRIQVAAQVSGTGSQVSPQVTISKRLLSDNLYVTLSSTIGNARQEVMKVEYLFNKNVSLVGERDELGSVGGDIKFRFEFK